MSTRKSVRAALAVALGVLAVGCAKDNAPAPQSKFMSLTGTSSVAFALQSGRVVMSADASSSGGGGFFSASVAGGGTFSGSTTGSASFDGSVGGSASFSAAAASGGSFTGSALLGPNCSLSSLCDFAFAFCQELGGDADCSQADISACDAEVNSADFQSQFATETAGLPAGFICDVLNFLECISQDLSALTASTDADTAALEQCANSSGLGAFLNDLGGDSQPANGNN